MKKFLRNGLLFALVGAFVFTACDPTEETPVETAPEVTVSVENEQEAYLPGDVINLVVDFTADAAVVGSVLTIETPEVIFTYSTTGISPNSDGDKSIIDLNAFSVASATEGTFKIESFQIPELAANSTLSFTVEMEDEDGRIGEGTLDLQVGEGETINSYETVLIGGFNNLNTGSFYDAIADSVYSASSVRESEANQANIDFLYYFADIPGRTIASPDSEAAQTSWDAQDGSSYPFTSVENSTRFKLTSAGTDFENISTNAEIADAFSEVGDELIRVTDLEEGDMYAFRTDNSKGSRFGIFVVTAVEGNSSGSITISVKSQTEDN